jgi:NADH-quinone oxidoreductase subunit J
METVLFTILSLVAILSALLVITAPGPIASALYLVVTMFSLAGFYVLLQAPFVAATQIIVYAGAVIVLILFVIMLLNLKAFDEKMAGVWKVAGISVGALLLLIIFMSFMSVRTYMPSKPELGEGFGTVRQIGEALFTKYLYAFEVVSVLLLLAVIGAVALIRKPDDEEGTRAD